MHAALDERLAAGEQAFIDQVVAGRTGRPGALLSVLEAVQKRQSAQLSADGCATLRSGQADVPLSRIYSVATFYALFNLRAAGG